MSPSKRCPDLVFKVSIYFSTSSSSLLPSWHGSVGFLLDRTEDAEDKKQASVTLIGQEPLSGANFFFFLHRRCNFQHTVESKKILD